MKTFVVIGLGRFGSAVALELSELGHEVLALAREKGIGTIAMKPMAGGNLDDYALARYDGTALYEYPHSAVGQSEWGSCNFMHSRGEVRSFLQSAAEYWLTEFHMDGLRMDAVSRAIYWQGDPARGVNSNAVEFLKNMNRGLKERHPSVILAAEDSTSFPGVTELPEKGGLGFDYKWDMGWMNDTLEYFRTDPLYRGRDYNKLTFSMAYFYGERYLLPLSHDEVVHGKASMVNKMWGDYETKFASLRALYGYQFAHPGKKLNFMGGEFGHFIEWKYDDELDWFLLVYERHPEMQKCVRRLNHFYRETPALWQVDDGWDGFQWICANDCDNSVVAFLRTDRVGNAVLCVTNFTPTYHPVYKIGLPMGGTLEEVFNTDRTEWGGSGKGNSQVLHAVAKPWNDLPFSCDICVPPMATVYFRYDKLIPQEASGEDADAEDSPVPKAVNA